MDPTNPDTYNTLEQHAEDTDKLTAFRKAIGIHEPILCDHCREEVGFTNTGLYKQVIKEERNAGIIFYTSSTLVTTCLLLQLFLATALTALGACNGPSRWVTYLSIANFFIGLILGYARFKQLPERPGQQHTALNKVREYIELREREFKYPTSKLEVSVQVKTILEMHRLAVQAGQQKGPSATKLMVSHAKDFVKRTSRSIIDRMTKSSGGPKKASGTSTSGMNVTPFLSYGTNMLSTLKGKVKKPDFADTSQITNAIRHEAEAHV